MCKMGSTFFISCGVLKSILHEKEVLESKFTAARAIMQLYLTSAAHKKSLASLPLHVFFSDSHRCVCRCVVYLVFTI